MMAAAGCAVSVGTAGRRRPYDLDLGATLLYAPVPGRRTLVSGNVSVLNDWVGSNNATQGTGSLRPALAVGAARGQDALNCDGGDRMPMGSGSLASNTNVTVLVVCRADDTNVNRAVMYPVAIGVFGPAHDSTRKRKVRMTVTGDLIDSDSTTNIEAWCIRRDSSTTRLSINGVAQSLADDTAAPSAISGAGCVAAVNSSGTWPWDGLIFRISVVPRYLTDAEETGWANDCRQWYGAGA